MDLKLQLLFQEDIPFAEFEVSVYNKKKER